MGSFSFEVMLFQLKIRFTKNTLKVRGSPKIVIYSMYMTRMLLRCSNCSRDSILVIVGTPICCYLFMKSLAMRTMALIPLFPNPVLQNRKINRATDPNNELNINGLSPAPIHHSWLLVPCSPLYLWMAFRQSCGKNWPSETNLRSNRKTYCSSDILERARGTSSSTLHFIWKKIPPCSSSFWWRKNASGSGILFPLVLHSKVNNSSVFAMRSFGKVPRGNGEPLKVFRELSTTWELAIDLFSFPSPHHLTKATCYFRGDPFCRFPHGTAWHPICQSLSIPTVHNVPALNLKYLPTGFTRSARKTSYITFACMTSLGSRSLR